MRVAVIGGGVTGLAAAHRLRLRLGPDADITVIDLDHRLGGKLRAASFAGRPYDVGAEAFLARRPEVTALLAELGHTDDIVHPARLPATVRAGGHTRPIPPRTVLGVPASADAVAGVLSADGVRRVAAEADLPPLRLDGADIGVGPLLTERLGPEVTQRLVDPLLGGVYAGRADGLGLRATMPALAAALDAGAGGLLPAAASLLPAPATARPGPAGDPPPVFGTLRTGLAALPALLAAAAGARVLLGRPVRVLHRRPAGWRLELGSTRDPEFLDADAVVLAVPAPAARRLLDPVAPAAAAALGRIELASMAVVALALPADTPLPATSGVLLASGERHADGTPFVAKAFTFSSRKWPHLAGTTDEPLLVRGSVGRYGDATVLHRDDADLVTAVRTDLAELVGAPVAPIGALVTRWGGGLPQYGVGHLDTVAAIERAVAAVPRLAIAGAALHGVGVPACVAGGAAAAGQIADQLAAADPAGWPAAARCQPARS